ELDGVRVSSGRIRELLAAGDMETAERLLGRLYAITGTAAAAEDGWWTLAATAPFAMPAAGSYAIEVSMQDQSSEGSHESGMCVIDGTGRLRLVDIPLPRNRSGASVIRIAFLHPSAALY
ncbi:MAG: hypothetical protein LH650_16670, partial [Chloroflexi bacterium]|nr:hypothetical protein [Chloroflexota bacterium]